MEREDRADRLSAQRRRAFGRLLRKETKMNRGVPLAQVIKWWDAVETVGCVWDCEGIDSGLQMARQCSHPDAQWLASLFPAGRAAVTSQHFLEVMREQKNDARAFFLEWLHVRPNKDLLLRSAQMGYAPAEAEMASVATSDDETFVWAQRSSAQGDRHGAFQLGWCLHNGVGCVGDKARALELFRFAAECGRSDAQFWYGLRGFGEFDWERYYWQGLAALRGSCSGWVAAVLRLLLSFERGEYGRILHTVALLIPLRLGVPKVLSHGPSKSELEGLQRVLGLQSAMLNRTRRAVACWSVVGLRCGLVKDVRVMIAKMVWQEPWHWSAEENECPKAKKFDQ
jgi:TPR repeat protein